ncbi:MAG: hypothetical protein JXA00_06090, partial [Candidatus Thermoplasmatota archaeon]|nr:hypothetical protein [Candidatus Thermoplasmatota archaeon]
KSIRAFETFELPTRTLEKIDWLTKPDMYVRVFINDIEFKSQTWKNTAVVSDPQFTASLLVPADEEFVNITIQLWDRNLGLDRMCDISTYHFDGPRSKRDVDLMYSVKSGHWLGDDWNDYDPTGFDPSGYGRLNGCDDNSMYERDRDCEIVFDITQTDPDGDGIPAWVETTLYGTDPAVDDTGRDDDGDGVPIEWEYHWGHGFYYDWNTEKYYDYWFYDPFVAEDHASIDPEHDGLDNVEEYLTSQWGSDPFRKDLFVELDQMEASPDGFESILPEKSKEMLYVAYNRQNVVLHLDDGCMGGSDMIPFDDSSEHEELQDMYYEYFLHGNLSHWRRGIFHYGLVVYDAGWAGYVFWNGHTPYIDSFQISSWCTENQQFIKALTPRRKAVVYASGYMHECGHTLGIFHSNTPGCDDQQSTHPWMKNYWKWRPYKSCMNYGYVYLMVDYSDGSRGRNDFDDWDRIDMEFFQREAN